MRTNPLASYQSHGGEQPREAKKELGKDEFLKILAAQFRGQNPLDPINDTEFIAQMAQFSSLEQLQNISDKLDVFAEDLVWGQYLSLLGKEVQALADMNGEFQEIEGIVTGVSFRDGEFQLEIDDRDYDITAIISVGVAPTPEPEPIVVVMPGTDEVEEQGGEEGHD